MRTYIPRQNQSAHLFLGMMGGLNDLPRDHWETPWREEFSDALDCARSAGIRGAVGYLGFAAFCKALYTPSAAVDTALRAKDRVSDVYHRLRR